MEPALKRNIENGMSSFEVLQFRINHLEARSHEPRQTMDRLLSDIDGLTAKKDSRTTSRRERWEIEGELKTKRNELERIRSSSSEATHELMGMRKAVDVIIVISNYGGEVNDSNRRRIEEILRY